MDSQTPYEEPAFTTLATTGFASAEFAENPEGRCACLLLLDTSTSMRGHAIDQLNAGLVAFHDELAADPLASKRVEISILTFGPPRVIMDFTTAAHFQAPVLHADGNTPMGAAIMQGLQHLEERKQVYRANGVSYYRPWVVLITDGSPTDEYLSAARHVHDGEAAGKFSFFAVGVSDADMAKLGQIAPPTRSPQKLDGLRFRDLFSWLSSSMKSVSSSAPGSQITLAAPGWISAQT